MRKIQILGFTLVAVVAFSAVTATSAFAATKVWLISGVAVAAKTATTGTGEWSLSDAKGGAFGEEIKLDCNLLEIGSVSSGGLDETTEVLNLAGTTKDITECTVLAGICPSPLFEFENLPWKTELLLEGANFIDDITGTGTTQAAWVVSCAGVVDLCEDLPERWVAIKNEPTGVDAAFIATLLANCTRGGEDSGELEGTLLITTTGGVLSASE